MRNGPLHLQLPRPIAIVGLGISGDSVLQLLIKSGIPRSEIFTFDQKQVADFNDPQALMAKTPQTLCVSPGVPLSTPWITQAIKSGVRLTSELEIAFAFLQSEKVICITGSLGKSTTTALLGEGALTFDSGRFCGGNLGIPLAKYALNLLNGFSRAQNVILELSSYQLENFSNLKSDLSVFTFLSANHLERYSNLQSYYDTKLSLLEKTRQTVVVNRNGGDNLGQIESKQSQYSFLDFAFTDRNSLSSQDHPKLIGSHNLDNVAVAFAVADKMGWPASAKKAMLNFPGLPHRMENVGRWQNILFINDSKATTMDSVLEAYNSLQSEKKGEIHLLLGGRDKNLPWNQLTSLSQEKDLRISFFGECGDKAKQMSRLEGSVFSKLQDALTMLGPQLKENDIVLFSPGGTSLDEFKNFEERGLFFKNWVLTKFGH